MKLIKNSYGKERVRLTHVRRGAERTEVRQLTVGIELEGEFEDTYLTGDNRKVVATDSMKNTVYVLARNHDMESIEGFAGDLARHFLERYPHVASTTVRVEEQPWEAMPVRGGAHPTAFVGVQGEVRTCLVREERGQRPVVRSGIDGLLVLKTSDSSFVYFLRDEFTTLPDAPDRLLATVIQAEWLYGEGEIGWNEARAAIRTALLETFAGHRSLSVQQTLFAMGEAALRACPGAEQIEICLPNKHHLPVNLTPFGLDNPTVLFCPTDEPYGCISGTVSRSDLGGA